MDKKYSAMAIVFVILFATVGGYLYYINLKPQQKQSELDFSVSGTNDCLRFLHRTVNLAYLPISTCANEQWRLSIECTQMPGAGGWTEVYMYPGYWNEGINNMCIAEDLYPIISQIETTNFQIKTNSTFTHTFGDNTPQSYTLFFLMPPGGNGTYHIMLNKIQ